MQSKSKHAISLLMPVTNYEIQDVYGQSFLSEDHTENSNTHESY